MDYACVAITGLAGSGKDEIGKYIENYLGNPWMRISMTPPLLREYEARHNLPFGFMDNNDEKVNRRDGLTKLARELCQYDQYWFLHEPLRIWRETKCYPIITGLRIPSNTLLLVEFGALVIECVATDEKRLERLGEKGYNLAKNDELELIMHNYHGPKLVIENNGSKEDLYQKVKKEVIPYIGSPSI